MVERFLGLAVAVLSVLLARSAAAQEPKHWQSVAVGQENFGFGASAGSYNPNGAELRVGAPAVALDVTAGYKLFLLQYGGYSYPNNKLKLIAPLELSPQLLIHILTLSRDVQGALRLGYRYDVALGHGGTLGGQVGKRWGHILLEGMWGFSVYPNAAEKLRGHEVPAGTSFNYPPAIDAGLSVDFLYFPG